MGIQGQAALLFKSKEVGLDDIVYVIEQLHAERQRRQLTIRARPKVTVDSSLLAYKFLESSLHPSDGVSLICRVLANRNIDVSIISDPPTRHHSKRAHHQRVGKKEKARLQLMLSRMELSNTQSEEKEKVEQLTNVIRKLEKAEGRCFLPPNFIDRLQLLVSEYVSS
jgi:thymidylate synthase